MAGPLLSRILGDQQTAGDTPQKPRETYAMVQDDHERINDLDNWRKNTAVPALNGIVETVNAQTDLLSKHDKTIKDAIDTANKFITWSEQHMQVTHQAEDKQLNELTQATVDHAAAIVAHEDRLKGVETTVQGVRDYTQDKLNSSIASLNGELSAMNSKIEATNAVNQQQATDISNISGNLKTSVDEIMKALSEATNSLGVLKSNQDNFMSAVRDLQGRIQAIEDIAGIKTQAKPPTGETPPQPPKPPGVPPGPEAYRA